jgi:hypothetical protein
MKRHVYRYTTCGFLRAALVGLSSPGCIRYVSGGSNGPRGIAWLSYWIAAHPSGQRSVHCGFCGANPGWTSAFWLKIWTAVAAISIMFPRGWGRKAFRCLVVRPGSRFRGHQVPTRQRVGAIYRSSTGCLWQRFALGHTLSIPGSRAIQTYRSCVLHVEVGW